jgi:predicted DNA-binding protein
MGTGETNRKHGNSRHIYLKREQEELLDVIAKTMGKSRIGIEPTRSQLIAKAVENYIEDCRKDSLLASAIEQADVQLSSDRAQPQARGLGPRLVKLN